MEKTHSKAENPASRRSKTALMIAFTNLLTERDISEISISEITDRAGLSRQTFYTNFSKKEDILDDTVRRLFEMYAEHVEDTAPNPYAVIADYLAFWAEHHIFLSVLFKSRLGYLFLTRNNRFFENELAWLSKSLAKNEKEIPYIKAFLASTLFSALNTWVAKEDMSIAELTGFVEDMLEGRVLK